MKKTILSILAMMFIGIAANAAESKIIRAHDSNDDWHDYYYNAQNQLFWEIYGTTRREYAYNEAGQLTSMKQYGWVAATGVYTLTQSEEYTYGADGNMSQKVVTKSSEVNTYTYTKYENGIAVEYSDIQKMTASGKEYKYDYKCEVEMAEGRVVKILTTELDYDYPEDGFCVKSSVEYTYDAAGNIATETQKQYNYDINKVRSTNTLEYIYAELDAAYAPTGLKAESDNEVVTLTWNAVPGTDQYQVVYDQTVQIVYGTTYRHAVATGDRQFTVQAIIDGIARNAATPVTATVVDPGKLPITNLAVGEITKTTEQTESPEAPTRDFFNIPLTWTLPEGHSEVEKYYVYYTSTRYGKGIQVTVSDKDATSFTLKIDPDEVAEWDTNGKPVKGVETPIYMTVVYVTGESDKSNIVTVNPYDEFYSGIEEVKNEELRVKNLNFYNLAGQRVNANNPTRGNKSIIINNGKKVLK